MHGECVRTSPSMLSFSLSLLRLALSVSVSLYLSLCLETLLLKYIDLSIFVLSKHAPACRCRVQASPESDFGSGDRCDGQVRVRRSAEWRTLLLSPIIPRALLLPGPAFRCYQLGCRPDLATEGIHVRSTSDCTASAIVKTRTPTYTTSDD